jgi:hypothetical protein
MSEGQKKQTLSSKLWKEVCAKKGHHYLNTPISQVRGLLIIFRNRTGFSLPKLHSKEKGENCKCTRPMNNSKQRCNYTMYEFYNRGIQQKTMHMYYVSRAEEKSL